VGFIPDNSKNPSIHNPVAIPTPPASGATACAVKRLLSEILQGWCRSAAKNCALASPGPADRQAVASVC
jgi:hypothetical protein